MKIAIFETEHFEGAYPVIRLFDNGENAITVFCYEQSFRQFQFLFKEDFSKYKWVVKQDDESKNHFIYRMYQEIKKGKMEILYLNTISNNFHSYALLIKMLKNVRTIVTIHNINNYFQFIPAFSLRRFIRNGGKKRLIKNTREFNVVSLTMIESLQKRLPSFKKVHCIPGAVFEKEKINAVNLIRGQQLKIVVPGTVDVRRRDYQKVFDLLYACNNLDLPIVITLLGGYYGDAGKRIIEACEKYILQFDNLQFYNAKIVDQPEFDKVMNESHFVWIPSVITTIINDEVREIYGETMASGNLFDIIKHAKPFIVPAQLRFDEYLQSSSFCYQNTNDIIEYIRRFINEPSLYYQLCKKALLNSENYTAENVRKRNQDLLLVQ